jgi:hypothetical protein
LKKLYVFALCSALSAQPAFALTDEQKAARIALANEFVRELSAAQQVREILENNSALDISGTDQSSIILRASGQVSSELGTTRRMLDEGQLDPAMDAVRAYYPPGAEPVGEFVLKGSGGPDGLRYGRRLAKPAEIDVPSKSVHLGLN